MADKTARIIVTRDELLPALALAGKVVERKSTIPILLNLKLTVEGDRMVVTGTDLDCEITTGLACRPDKAAAEASFTLPAANFHDAVRKLPDSAEIALLPENDAITLLSGRSRFRMPVLPASDFPALPTGQFSHSLHLTPEVISKLIASVSFAISTEETRYYLNGIYWHTPQPGQLGAVATDGHRLARFAMAAVADGMPGIIVPRRTIGLLKSLLGETRSGLVEINLSETKIRFDTESGTLVSKLIDGTYPDYQRVIPSGNANRFTLSRENLARAVDRVTTISSERGSAVKFTFEKGGSLLLAAANPDTGSATDEVAMETGGGTEQSVEIGFNGRYCLDMLNASDAERLTFSLGDAGSPALVEPADGDEPRPLFVLMPMRV